MGLDDVGAFAVDAAGDLQQLDVRRREADERWEEGGGDVRGEDEARWSGTLVLFGAAQCICDSGNIIDGIDKCSDARRSPSIDERAMLSSRQVRPSHSCSEMPWLMMRRSMFGR